MRKVTGTSPDRQPFAQLTDRAIGAGVASKPRCADGVLDPDKWFPISIDAETARPEAADAIASCTACPVHGACLELALRPWGIGQHGAWGMRSARFDGQRDVQRRSLPRRAYHSDCPSERVHAVGEADQPGSARGIGTTAAVVADGDFEHAIARLDGDTHAGGIGVLRGVGERFGHDVVGGDLRRLGQPGRHAYLELDADG